MSWPTRSILEHFLNAEIKHDKDCVHCQKILSDAEVAREFIRQKRLENEDLTLFAAACHLAWQNKRNKIFGEKRSS